MQRGFTLIELSIVLIIIGLLVGGVLAGRDLIEQAKLGSVVTNFRNYQTAVNTFDLKYEAVPGDMANATSFWSSTANGDGNRHIDTTAEQTHPWEHLSRAGLAGGDYESTGTSTSDRFNFGSGQTGPESPFGEAGYVLHTTYANPNFGYYYKIAIQLVTASWNAALTPAQGKQLDTKMDDGNATTGKIAGINGSDVNDTASAADNCNTVTVVTDDYVEAAGSGDYLLTNSDVACRMGYFYQ